MRQKHSIRFVQNEGEESQHKYIYTREEYLKIERSAHEILWCLIADQGDYDPEAKHWDNMATHNERHTS